MSTDDTPIKDDRGEEVIEIIVEPGQPIKTNIRNPKEPKERDDNHESTN
jgi:hypothetical protein